MIDFERFTTAQVGEDMFVLDQESGESYRLGGSGARLWVLLSGGTTTDAAARIVATETGASYEQVLADTISFVTHLRESGILQSD